LPVAETDFTGGDAMRGARSIAQWKSLLAAESGPVRERLVEIYGPDPSEIRQRLQLWNDVLDGFARQYSPDANVILARAPGRINLMGMHIDHRGGSVNTIAVGETLLAVEPRADDLVVLNNLDSRYPPRQFSIREELPREKIADWDKWTMARYTERAAAGTQADWSNYVRAAVLYLQHFHTRDDGTFSPALKGMNVFAAGNLRPAAGLSSSSTVVVSSTEACLRVNGIEASDSEIAEFCRQGEWYVGTRGGGGDHAAIKFARRGSLTHIGAFPLTAEQIPFPEDCCAVLCDSLIVAAKTAGARNVFNQRVACYELGLLLLRKRFPERARRMEHLRDVNPETLDVGEGERAPASAPLA